MRNYPSMIIKKLNGSMKMVIEDGDLKKRLSLQVAEGNASKIDLILKGK